MHNYLQISTNRHNSDYLCQNYDYLWLICFYLWLICEYLCRHKYAQLPFVRLKNTSRASRRLSTKAGFLFTGVVPKYLDCLPSNHMSQHIYGTYTHNSVTNTHNSVKKSAQFLSQIGTIPSQIGIIPSQIGTIPWQIGTIQPQMNCTVTILIVTNIAIYDDL